MGGKINVHTPGITGVNVLITDQAGNGRVNATMSGSSQTWDLTYYDDGWFTVTVKKIGYEVQSAEVYLYGGGTLQQVFELEEELPFYDLKVNYSPVDASVTVKDSTGRTWNSK